MKPIRAIGNPVTATAVTLALLAGYATQVAPVSAADNQAVVAAPSIEETKAIAEEGFLYGLPIAMNYAVMNEYAVNRDSGQFKAPFNSLKNETHLLTYKDTAVISPNSDTLYSLGWVDLRAEPIVISVPTVEKSRYFSVQLVDGSTYNYGYIGSRTTGSDAGNYLLAGPG